MDNETLSVIEAQAQDIQQYIRTIRKYPEEKQILRAQISNIKDTCEIVIETIDAEVEWKKLS